MSGALVTLEGIDGCGKTSVVQMLSERLRKEGKEVFLTTEPTKTWLGNAVKRGISENHPALTEAFLFMADRASHSREISQRLKEGKLVLCDRYADSTVCYQSVSMAEENFRGDAFEWLRKVSDSFVLKPDLTILLDIEPRKALNRIQSRDRRTKFEQLSFLTKVRKNFLRLAAIEERIEILDASLPLESVVEGAEKKIRRILR